MKDFESVGMGYGLVILIIGLLVACKLVVVFSITGDGATDNVARSHAKKRWGDKVVNVQSNGVDREGYHKYTAVLQDDERRAFVCSGFWGECYNRSH